MKDQKEKWCGHGLKTMRLIIRVYNLLFINFPSNPSQVLLLMQAQDVLSLSKDNLPCFCCHDFGLCAKLVFIYSYMFGFGLPHSICTHEQETDLHLLSG